MNASTALLVFGIGVVLVGIAIALFMRTRRFLATASRSPATVVGHDEESERNSDGRQIVYYHPILEFKDSTGVQRRVISSVGSSRRSHPVGANVTVLYDAKDPEKIKLERFLDLWVIPLSFCGLGVVFLTIALVNWLVGI